MSERLENVIKRQHLALLDIDMATIEDLMAASEGSTLEQIVERVKALRAERDALRAKAAAYDTARADHATECIEFAEILEREGYYNDGRVYRAKAAALAAPADGSADADADAADGSVQS
jgi:IMP cyclohydrolase